MLTANRIGKSFGLQVVLDQVTFSVNPGERVGLVGPNGCGKTTLLRILAGLDTPDSGTVSLVPSDARVGYLAQGADLGSLTVGEVLDRARGDLAALAMQVEELAAALAHSPTDPELGRRYDEALSRLASGSEGAGQAKAILAALGLDDAPLDLPAFALSGGQKTRLGLALLLLSGPQFLILDEPTNHLDLDMLEWLEGWLNNYPGAALIVSHDRAFLDNTVTRILDLDPETHTVRAYTGNYTGYVEARLAERERQSAEWRDQQAEIRRMKQDIVRTRGQALQVELSTTPRQPGVRRYAKKVAAKAKSREKKLERYLESDERVDKPKIGWQMKLELDGASPSGQDVLALEGLSAGYPGRVLLRDLNLSLRRGARAVLTGPNGSGKTTLIKTITGQIPPLEGRVRLGASIRLGYMAQEHESLDPSLDALSTILRQAPMSDTEARSFLHFFLFSGDDVFVPVGSLSFGERARLMLACLVAQGCNLLLLDEPINHLDIPSRARFEQALAGFDGTVLAIVHDRYLIERFATEVWTIQGDTIRK